ncbi:hypothetical protein [Polyangium jinanense]|nr:hypothetical protein [Polyangium jinanense]
MTILQFFYGEDIEFHDLASGESTGLGQVLFGVLALAALGITMRR